MCGWHPLAPLRHTVRHIVGKNAYNSVVRPAAKIGAGIAVGALTGGVGAAGLAGLGTLSASGAIAGGLSSGLAGGFGGKKAFNPISNVLVPGAAGYAVGGSQAGQAFDKAYSLNRNLGQGVVQSLYQGGKAGFDTLASGGLGGAGNAALSLYGSSALGSPQGGYIQPSSSVLNGLTGLSNIAQQQVGGGSNQNQQNQQAGGGGVGFGAISGVDPYQTYQNVTRNNYQ